MRSGGPQNFDTICKMNEENSRGESEPKKKWSFRETSRLNLLQNMNTNITDIAKIKIFWFNGELEKILKTTLQKPWK